MRRTLVKTLIQRQRWLAMLLPCLLNMMFVPFSYGQEAGTQRLEDVLRYAYLTNPRLQAAREELHGTDELVPQAEANWRPSVTANGNITNAHYAGDNFVGGDGTTSKEMALELNQPVYRGGRTEAATASAENTVKAQRAILDNAEQELMLNVATAYMDVLRDSALLRLATQNRDLITHELDGAKARLAQGDATSTDVAQAQSRVANADADVAQVEGSLRKTGAQYAALTGLQPENLRYPTVAFHLPSSLDAAIGQARDGNPSVVASRYLSVAATADIDTVFGELLPSVSFTGDLDKQYDPQPGISDRFFGRTIELMATVPLYEGGATRSRVRQAKHNANRRSIDTLEAGREAEQQASAAWQDLISARAAITARGDQVAAEAKARDGVHQEVALGTRTVLDELDADQEYFNAETALVTARRDEAVAQFELARAVGILNATTLGFGDARENHEAELEEANDKILGMDVTLEKGAY
jgi:outer membrane protein